MLVDVPSHSHGRRIFRMYHRNEACGTSGYEPMVHARGSCLGNEAAASMVGAQVISNLHLSRSFDGLVGESAVTDELACRPQAQSSQSEPIRCIPLEILCDPASRPGPFGHVRIESLRIRVIEYTNKGCFIVRAKLAQRDAIGFQNDLGWNQRPSTAQSASFAVIAHTTPFTSSATRASCW